MSAAPKGGVGSLRRRRCGNGPSMLLMIGFLALISLSNEWLPFESVDYLPTFSSVPAQKNVPTIDRVSLVLSRLQQDNDAGKNNDPVSVHNNRTVEFLQRSNFVSYGELYSGMWWQTKETFMETNFDDIKLLEEATFQAYLKHWSRGILLTRDWLDMSVEHLSKYIKVLMAAPSDPLIGDQIASRLAMYVQQSKPVERTAETKEVLDSTIAVLPFKGSQWHGEMEVFELTATLTSLWRVGIPRAVVVVATESDEIATNQSFALLRAKNVSMEIHSIEYIKLSDQQKRLIPKIALKALQVVFNQSQTNPSDPHVVSWLGQNVQRWKYVYFTEPDLVLNIRPSAMPSIMDALKSGSLLAAHRLEPIPHERDFVFRDAAHRRELLPKMLPDRGVFADIHRLNPLEGDSCCDQGRYFPANPTSPLSPNEVRRTGTCASVWAHCGFLKNDVDYRDPAKQLESHKLILPYSLFSIEGGTGLPVLGANQRLCVPQAKRVCKVEERQYLSKKVGSGAPSD